jgi:hypothetical protein
MSARDEEELIAERWLHAQGYASERPAWLPPGRNPDYWATSGTLEPPNIWAEVKSIEPDDGTIVLSKYRELIRAAEIPIGMHGHGVLQLNPHATEQSVRWVLKAFAQQAPRFVERKILLAFVQQQREGRSITRAEVNANIPEILWLRGSGTGRQNIPYDTCQEHHADTKIIYSDGQERTAKAFHFFDWGSALECALIAHIDPAKRPFGSLLASSGGTSSADRRTVRAVEEANSQIKTACLANDAPGVVLLVPRDRFLDDRTIEVAVYGKLTVTFTSTGNVTGLGEPFHGQDGAFRPNKNTHVSAAVHVRPDGTATFFPNPHARRPISENAALFANATRTTVNFVSG